MNKSNQHSGKEIYINGDVSVIDCKQCGYAHVNPLPIQEQLDKYYSEGFYQVEKTNYIDDFEKDKEWWSMNYRWLINDIVSYMKPISKSKHIKLLDVGSGPGLLMHVANSLGLETMGIEPSSTAYKYSVKHFGLNVKNTTIEKVDKSIGKFDIITSYLVLEHILNPLDFLKQTSRFLSSNGMICIVVPNDFNPIQNSLASQGKKSWWVNTKDHLNYFNKQSLKRLFEKVGLEVVEQTVTFPIDLFLLMGMDYISNPELGPKCHTMRKLLEFNFDKHFDYQFKCKFYKSLSDLNIGRELVLIAKKNESKYM
jgi:2-polyprenyl-3-methyl-5-hydroxy-6-metoxy-1,4-benzoquinol methylase